MKVNVQNCRIVLRPRGALEVADLTLCWIRREWRTMAWLVTGTVMPLWLVLCALGWLTDGDLWLFLVGVMVAPLVQSPVTVAVAELVFAERVSLRRVIRGWRTRLGAWLGAWALFGVGLLLAIPTCGYGLPVVWAGLLFSTELALMERQGVGGVIGRGTRLVGASFLSVCTGVVLRGVGTMWIVLSFEMAGQALVASVLQLGEPFGSLWSDGVATPYALLGLLMSHLVFAVYRVLLYLDIRTASEGWDLKVGLMAAVESR